MASHIDAKFFRRQLRRLWKENGLKFEGRQPGLEIQQLMKISRRRSSKQKLQHFDLWNAIYDEYCSWLLSVSAVVNNSLQSEAIEDKEVKRFFGASCIVLWRIISDLLAIRELCNAGFDRSAKPLVRVAIEHIDLLYLLFKRPDLAEEFLASDLNEDTNKFWYTHLRGKKVRKYMISDWKELFESEESAIGFDEWLYSRHDVLSQATHPSFPGSWSATYVPVSKGQDPWLGYLGEKSDISANTFSEVCTHVWKLMFLLNKFPFEVEGHSALSLPYKSDDELHSHVKEGGRALIGMFISFSAPEVANLFYHEVDTADVPLERPDPSSPARR
jgi:hypothetical protein